ncbi:Hypothetical protein POVN_LOCUS551 [uncultured virus]|nr:Hypothetical protein POVN_LOCUS551 [uncultured virus]
MDVVKILLEMADRLEKLKGGDIESIDQLAGWVTMGGFESFKEPVTTYLEQKLVEPKPVLKVVAPRSADEAARRVAVPQAVVQAPAKAVVQAPAKAVPKQFYKYLQGPVELARHVSTKYNKDILLMSDESLIDGTPCSADPREAFTLTQFLDYNILSTDKTVDLYLDVEYITSSVPRRASLENSYMTRVATHFAECLTYDKKACRYPNARVHYVGIPAGSDAFNALKEAFRLFTNSKTQNVGFDQIKHVLQVTHPELKTQLSDVKAVQKWLDSTLNRSLINKQVRNIKNKDARIRLTQYFENEVASVTKHTLDDLTYDSLLQIAITKDIGKALNMQWKLSGLLGVHNDVYLMARVFRSFRQVAGKRSEDPQHVIIFTASFRAVRYHKILRILGSFIAVYTAKETSVRQCLDISGLPLPLYD